MQALDPSAHGAERRFIARQGAASEGLWQCAQFNPRLS